MKFYFLNFQLTKFYFELDGVDKNFLQGIFLLIKHFKHVAGCVDQSVKRGETQSEEGVSAKTLLVCCITELLYCLIVYAVNNGMSDAEYIHGLLGKMHNDLL